MERPFVCFCHVAHCNDPNIVPGSVFPSYVPCGNAYSDCFGLCHLQKGKRH